MASEKRLMVLDSASMYFRAFFGVPEVTADDGTPVNAVRGFLDFISRLVGEYRPSHLVCAWDNDWRPQWRVDLLPSYKAHRVVAAIPGPRPDIEEVPDPLEIQIPIILEVLDAAGLCVVGADGFEADDVIGTLATGASMPVDVVTGDRDLFQLVDNANDVRILYIARGVGKHERMTDELVVEKYSVLPGQYADFATLRGDASDGLPGVGRRRRQDGGQPAPEVRRPPGHHRGRRGPRVGDVPGPPTQDPRRRGLPPRRPEGRRRRARHRPRAVRRDPAGRAARPVRLGELAERYNLDSPVKRLTAVLAG